MADVVDHPLGDQELGQLGQAPGRKGQVVVLRAGQGDLLISLRSGKVNVGGRPPAYFGARESNPSSLKLWITALTRSSEVKAIVAIWGTSIPWADQSTIWALRRRTTDPEPRLMLERSLFPSTLVISRTRTRSAMPPRCATSGLEWWTRPRNVAGHGTSTQTRSPSRMR